MVISFEEKEEELARLFSPLQKPEQRYQRIISFRTQLKPFKIDWKIPSNLVEGCQSIIYLHHEMKEERIDYFATSDALISAGIAALFLFLYNGQTPETILTKGPTILEKLGILSSLSPQRANGAMSLYLKMKKQALTHLMIQGA